MKLKGVVGIFSLLCLLFTPTLHATFLDSSIIGMFPKNVGEIAYADLSQARNFPWFAQFEQQVLPARFVEFAQFLKSVGIDPDTQIDGVAWALVPGARNHGGRDKIIPTVDAVLGIAIGRFNPATTQDFFETHKVRTVEFLNFKMYASDAVGGGNLFMMFVDSSTIAFGPRSLLERLIRARGGEEEDLSENETLIPLINQVNGNAIFWSVLNTAGARQAIHQFMPMVGQSAQAGHLIDGMRAMMINVQGSSWMEADILGVAGSPQDAIILSQFLQAALMLRQYQVTESNPDLAQILEGVSIAHSGNQLNISFTFTEDQLIGLVKHNSFVMDMSR